MSCAPGLTLPLLRGLGLQDANLTVTETLFNAMLKEDSDLPKFKIMPGITELLEEFEVRRGRRQPCSMRR